MHAKAWAFIGGGNMGSAILAGAVRAGVLTPAYAAVVEHDPGKHAALRLMTHNVFADGQSLRAWIDERQVHAVRILLAIKPQSLPAFAAEWRPWFETAPSRMLLSILAGVPIAKLAHELGSSVRLARAMPNTPARVGEGATAYCASASATPDDESAIAELFRAVGPLVIRTEEPLMDAFTAVAGSGPAYLFHLAEGMIRGAIDAGFDPAHADAIVRQTLLGAARLFADAPDESPAQLRQAVTSKGGTTEAALRVLAESDWVGTMSRAVLAARDRGRELGR